MGRPESPRITIERDQRGAWAWFCNECGWAGLRCDTRSFARQEGERHVCPPAAKVIHSGAEAT